LVFRLALPSTGSFSQRANQPRSDGTTPVIGGSPFAVRRSPFGTDQHGILTLNHQPVRSGKGSGDPPLHLSLSLLVRALAFRRRRSFLVAGGRFNLDCSNFMVITACYRA
jgi:hypothetical protein